MKPIMNGGIHVSLSLFLFLIFTSCLQITLPDLASKVIDENIGTAKELQIKADETAKKWKRDPHLVKIVGTDIDSAGENEAPGSQWTFLYKSKLSPTTLKVVFINQQIAIEETEGYADIFEPIGTFSHDSDDAIVRTVQQASLELLLVERANMELLSVNGIPTWTIQFLNDLGRIVSTQILKQT